MSNHPPKLRSTKAIAQHHKQAHMVLMQTHNDHEPLWTIPENVPLFTMATVAAAAGVAPPTIRAWFQREHVTLNEADTKAHTNGAPNRFTLRSVLMLAVMAELVRLGTSPGAAAEAAQHWLHHGVLEGQYGAPARREGGGLFPKPFTTFLTIGPEGAPAKPWPCEIVAVDRRDPRAQSALFDALFLRGRSSGKVILLNALDRRVRQVCYQSILGDAAPPEPDWEAEVAEMLAAESVRG